MDGDENTIHDSDISSDRVAEFNIQLEFSLPNEALTLILREYRSLEGAAGTFFGTHAGIL